MNKHDNDTRQYFTSETHKQRHQSSKPRKRRRVKEKFYHVKLFLIYLYTCVI